MAARAPLVYRLRRLPEFIHDEVAARQLLARAVSVSPSVITICSLATIITSEWSPQTRTATVMFDPLPPLLHQSPRQTQWEIRVPGLAESLLLDSHFIGLTPLYDVLPENSHDFKSVVLRIHQIFASAC
jgi:hypothetical protein